MLCGAGAGGRADRVIRPAFDQPVTVRTCLVNSADFVVIGAGVLGVNIATELKRRRPAASVVLLEKEPQPGLHASGRNSGVLHAGFYYTADSLKARFTRQGNARMKAYCEAKGLRINRCGKLVVARDESELEGLAELLRRGTRNGVVMEELDEAGARRIEPRAKTFRKALFSPDTATVDPAEVMRSMVADAQALGVVLRTGTRYLGRRPGVVDTSTGAIACGYVVNAAGLYADQVARDFGFSERYRILPFKGLYLYSSEPVGAFRTNIYPVPNLKNPFLGVHFTVNVDGHAKIGPTAIPCLWREQYGWAENFRFPELTEVLGMSAGLFLNAGFDFRGLAVEEIRKYYRPHLVAQAAALAEGVRAGDYVRWGKPGIRAQLVDTAKRTLVQDFCVEGDASSFHVLNAVSPGWTCSLPFAEHTCDEIERRLGGGTAVAPQAAAPAARN
jgi:L-2-hydroxyglutarate oxidase LhgO